MAFRRFCKGEGQCLRKVIDMATLGNYRIIKQIGEGGFGRIYQAKHLLLDELACLKQNLHSTEEDANILKLEAKLLWKLEDHHSIPTSKDLIELGKNNYVMVMSYIDGETLHDAVTRNSRLQSEEACWITERLLDAVRYCHYNGVIHSDIKPSNVFVEPAKHDIKLVDFGLAAYKPKIETRSIGSTPQFAAPELGQNKPPIPETDIYGAGLTMLYILGGDVAKKSLPKDVPKPIADFCQSLICYNPTDRPNWDKNNPLETLSDIREKVFGRRHTI